MPIYTKQFLNLQKWPVTYIWACPWMRGNTVTRQSSCMRWWTMIFLLLCAMRQCIRASSRESTCWKLSILAPSLNLEILLLSGYTCYKKLAMRNQGSEDKKLDPAQTDLKKLTNTKYKNAHLAKVILQDYGNHNLQLFPYMFSYLHCILRSSLKDRYYQVKN